MPPQPPPSVPFVAAVESTYLPRYDVDVTETTGHDTRWQVDLDALPARVRQLRYPVRWHRVEPEPGCYDWSETDAVLGHLRDRGLDPIVDLVHHTSYPPWLSDGFRDPRFGPAFLRYAEAVATRYPWLQSYTLFNEPLATLFLAGHEALWPPYESGLGGFRRLLQNVLPAISEAAATWRTLLPDARHIWVDTCEHHAADPGSPRDSAVPWQDYAVLANDRRHVALDLALGHDLDPDRPFLRELLRDGGESLLELAPLQVDLLGLDYYSHAEWFYDERGGHAPSPYPIGFAAIAGQYSDRYGLDMLLSETNLRGLPSDRISWLRYTLEQYELAVSRGVPLRGYCWFPQVDSADWDSLLARAGQRVDPVGVLSLDGQRRVRTSFTRAWETAAGGAPSSALPAYRFQAPHDQELAGFLPQLSHWDWQDPPQGDVCPPVLVPTPKETAVSLSRSAGPSAPRSGVPTSTPVPDLVVLSHLRWPWVWQRPQHLVSRMAAERAAAGAQTWFVEEPAAEDIAAPQLHREERDGVHRVWLSLPRGDAPAPLTGRALVDDRRDFDAPEAGAYGALLRDLFAEQDRPTSPDVLVYTPAAHPLAQALDPGRLAYDVMDDLASFANAPAALRLQQQRLLADADVVFTGGRSLHRSATQHRKHDCYLFPSGVDTAHYASSVRLRRPRPSKVAGYVGVVDERLDLELIGALARLLPEWTVRVVGPVAKIDEADLPQGVNLDYVGQVPYPDLPRVMAGFDVALMPFALNDATRSISPTKTLEYLAAGLPVVTTRVPDVVADYPEIVHFADTAEEFAAGCREVLTQPATERDRRLRSILGRQEWDAIAAAMGDLIRGRRGAARAAGESA